mgnify:CR=1 FL=1|tara:strand:+ start:7187 stop:7957 length:771 start_codon:yes stop_codon:yes gene_type:complete
MQVSNAQRRQIRKLIREEFKRQELLHEHIASVENKMILFESKAIKKGLTQFQINEGLAQLLIQEGLMDAGFDLIKRYLSSAVLNFLGVNETSDPILHKFFQNVLEAVDYTELAKYFGSNKCDEIMGMLTEAITETVVELGGAKVISYLAGKFLDAGNADKVQGALESSLSAVPAEAINEVVVGLVKGYLQEPMREFVCEGKLMDAIKGLFSGGGESGESGGGIFGSLLGLGKDAAAGGLGKMAMSGLSSMMGAKSE